MSQHFFPLILSNSNQVTERNQVSQVTGEQVYMTDMLFISFHRRAAKCLTVFLTHRCVDDWHQAALTDTSDCGTLAPKVPLRSRGSKCLWEGLLWQVLYFLFLLTDINGSSSLQTGHWCCCLWRHTLAGSPLWSGHLHMSTSWSLGRLTTWSNCGTPEGLWSS